MSKGEQRYYRMAGYWSLPCMCVPFLAPFVFGYWSNELFFFFGTVGLLFAVSGLRRGGSRAKLFASASLVLFALCAMDFLNFNERY